MAFNFRKRTLEARPDEVTASARLDLSKPYDAKYLRQVSGASKTSSLKPWQWYNEIGEVHYAVSRSARTAGYAKLQARKLEPDGTIGEVISGGMEAEIAEMISSPYGGQRGLVERYFTMMKVPGDAYLIRCRDEDGDLDGYDFLCADEIDTADMDFTSGMSGDGEPVFAPNTPIKRITHPRIASGEVLKVDVLAKDFIGRVWRPSSRFVDVADSPMRALETSCELLHLLTIGLRAKMMSRLTLNGILYIPNEINEVQSSALGAGAGQIGQNRVIDNLIAAATYNVLNREQAESAIPIFMSGPGAYADQIRMITMDRELYEVDMKLRAELLDRILMGLDVQPSNVRGMGDSNHWSAWAVEDDERRVNIQPDLETLCWALTRMVLHREMMDRGAKPGKIASSVIWYDLTSANVKTNLAEDARQAYDRVLISDAGARRLTGIPESDAPTDEEIVRRYGYKHGDPYLATYGLDLDLDMERLQPSSQPGPSADTDAESPEVGPGSSSGGPDDNDSDVPRRLRPA